MGSESKGEVSQWNGTQSHRLRALAPAAPLARPKAPLAGLFSPAP